MCYKPCKRPVRWEKDVGIKGPEWKNQDYGTVVGKVTGLTAEFLTPFSTHNLIFLKMIFYQLGDVSS